MTGNDSPATGTTGLSRRAVMHLIDTGGPGGAETIYHNLVTGLDRTRWRSIAVVPERDWLWSALEASDIEPLLLPTRGSFDLGYLRGISRLARHHGVDLIQTHLLSSSVYASLAAMRVGYPVVCTFHGPKDLAQTSYRRAKFRILRRRNNCHVFVSKSLQRWFVERDVVVADRTHVIYNGIDCERFQPRRNDSVRAELQAEAGDILIGAVGNLRGPKDYATFVRAAAILAGRSPRYRFAIVGAVDEPFGSELTALSRDLGIEDRLLLAGFRDRIEPVMNALDVYVLSSSSEGFSLTTVQAMASGVPVVATRCGGPEEIVTDGETGLLVPVRAPEALAEAIEDIAHDEERRIAFGRTARERAVRHFSVERMVSDYEKLYDACTPGSNTPAAGVHAGARARTAK